MCGIFAYTGDRQAGDIILEGLIILQNRGYDSVGITTLSDQYTTTKSASEEETSDGIVKLGQTISKHAGNKIGIGHTRWATHGPKTIKNTHPHFDNSKRFALVHNGVIENYSDIKEYLKSEGILCSTETDSEVIVQLLGYYAKSNSFPAALKKTLSDLEGTWGLAILDLENPKVLTLTRRGSPLLVGLGKEEYFVSSEISAFSRYTTHYISLEDDEIVTIDNNQIYLENNIEDRLLISKNPEAILLSPSPYQHWTLREIKEQEHSILNCLNNKGRIRDQAQAHLGGLESNKENLLKIKNLVIIGCGTSKHAGDFGAFLLRKISGFDSVSVVDAAEFDSDYCKYPNLGILSLSQSGETQDVLRCLKIFKGTSFSIVNKVDSSIARTTKCGVYCNAGREVAVASTKAFTSTVCILTLVAIWFAQNRDLSLEERKDFISCLHKLPLCFANILNDKVLDQKCDQVAAYLKNATRLFILGKGASTSIAYEGALKIKEIGYLHAEGYPGGSLKHGPFALIEKGTPIIIILLNNETRPYMESTIEEVKSRGAYTITITDIPNHLSSDLILRIPSSDCLTALLAVIPLQLIAYKLSVSKGINPDKPRNLAKVVTVI